MTIDYYWQLMRDKNFPTLYYTIVYGIMSRVIALAAMSSIFFQRSERQAQVIQEEKNQKSTIVEMKKIKEKTMEASKALLDSVERLSDITTGTTNSNHEIANNTGKVTQGIRETYSFLDEKADYE